MDWQDYDDYDNFDLIWYLKEAYKDGIKSMSIENQVLEEVINELKRTIHSIRKLNPDKIAFETFITMTDKVLNKIGEIRGEINA